MSNSLIELLYCYSKVDPLTAEYKVEKVKKNLYTLFEKYSSIPTSSTKLTPSSTSRKASSSHSLSQSLFTVSFLYICH